MGSSKGGKGPELLAPAGDWEKLRYAVAYGADAVYLSGRRYGMRSSAGNFDDAGLEKAVAYCHERGVRVYVTVNVMPRPGDLEDLPRHIACIDRAGADAVIVADIGVLQLVRETAPRLRIHISTQANVVNQAAACMWHRLGASRIVLARELSMEEVAAIRRGTPPSLELEVFAHGSMCMAYSGRCVLSNYLTGRDANRGGCAQPCRWNYRLVEEKRPGEYFPVLEDDGGAYILSARDLCMAQHVRALAEAGVDCLKLEGRAKTFYYAAVVTGAYRRAIDLALQGKGADEAVLSELEKVSHREYSTGFYFGPGGQQWQTDGYLRGWDICATVQQDLGGGRVRLQQKNKCAEGDEVELLSPGRPARPFKLGPLTDAEGAGIPAANHPMMLFETVLPFDAPPFSIIRKKTN